MKKFFLSLALLTACLLSADELVVLSTGDLHGSISGKNGYLKSLGTVISKLRSDCIIAPILIDAGDICKGWGSAEAMATDGKITFDILSHYKYDVFVPGNHEFERGEKFCFDMTRAFTGKTLAANFPSAGFDGSCIIERGNLKVGIIGIAHGGIGMMKHQVFNKEYQVIKEISAVKKELAKLKAAGATVFILVRHYGIHTATKQLLANFPEISLVINAHSHVDKIKRVGKTLCVQSFAPEVAVSTLEIKNGRVTESEAKFIKLDAEKKLSPETAKFFKEKVAPLTSRAKEPLQVASGAKSREEFIFDVMKKSADADIYLVRERKRSSQHFAQQLDEVKLSFLYSYWDKLVTFEMSSDEFEKSSAELAKTHTLILDKNGKTAAIAPGKTLKIAATEQVFFDIRMKKLFSAVSRAPEKLKYCGEKTFYRMLKESLTNKEVKVENKTQEKKIQAGNISIESVKFFYDGKEYSDRFSLKKRGKHKVKCELTVNVDEPEKIVFFNFKKPLMMTKWLLNGTRIDRNGDDILSKDITGVEGKLLKKGKNIFTCEAVVYIGKMPIGSGKTPKADYNKKSFVFQSIAPEKAKFSKGPVAGYGLTDRLSFSAFTDLPCKVELDFDGRKMVSKEGFFHQFEVKNLTPDTRYSYSMTLDCRGYKKTTDKFTIKTLPAKGKIRFAVLGDSQGNPECWRRIMAEAAKHKPDFLMHVGDLTSEGNQFSYWDLWDFDGVRSYQAQFPRFLATGNHERRSTLVTKLVCMADGKESQIYQVNENLKLIVLGFGRYGMPVKRYCAELDKQLKNANEKYIFFAGHGPAWSSGKHGNYKHSQKVIKVLEKNKVQAFFSGHDHSYSRSEPGNGTTQIVAASTSSMPYKPIKAHLNPHQKVFHSKMNYVIVDCLEDKAVFTAYGFDLDKKNLPVNMHVIDSGEWKPRKVTETEK
ncbi:MAG: metallophosphoesterase [Lentisphaeria bacterium]|nr:metallophosphoesterase [Lentisphaeria bacterium]